MCLQLEKFVCDTDFLVWIGTKVCLWNKLLNHYVMKMILTCKLKLHSTERKYTQYHLIKVPSHHWDLTTQPNEPEKF